MVKSVTSDGGSGIRSAVKLALPEVPHQRCLVHLARRVESLTTTKPKTEAGKELRYLAKTLYRIDSKGQRDLWLGYFTGWCNRYKELLNEKSYLKDGEGNKVRWWFTHKNLRSARWAVLSALPDLFHYLEDRNIPKQTNGLEGRFGQLKQHYRQHRGLNTNSREYYLAWYTKIMLSG